MSVAVPPSLTESFCFGGTAGVDYNVIPVPSQVSVVPNQASFTTGFPPVTRLARNAGGIPPFGKDMNGILRMISAHTAWVAAGGTYAFNSDVATNAGGYPIGAVIRSATFPTRLFLNLVDGNSNNPDSVTAGWMSLTPLYSSSAPTAGTYANNTLSGASDYILDVDCTAGNITLQGFVAQRDGQRLTIRKKDSTASVLTVSSGTGSVGNQVQAVGDLTLAQQYVSYTIAFNSTINGWLVV